MDWIKGRLKEPSSYAAAAVGGLGLGIIFTPVSYTHLTLPTILLV